MFIGRVEQKKNTMNVQESSNALSFVIIARLWESATSNEKGGRGVNHVEQTALQTHSVRFVSQYYDCEKGPDVSQW